MKVNNYKKERKTVAKIMRRLYKQNLTTTSGGNVSLINEDRLVFITSSQYDKSKIKWKNIAIVDENGNNLTPELKPSMEINIHLEIYKNRKDVNAIVHAHPIFTSFFAVTKNTLLTNLTGESRYILGDIAFADYKLMGTTELAQECAKKINSANCLIMKNHGALCVGKNLYEAFDRMEILEYTAKLNFLTLLKGKKKLLSDKQIKEIDDLAKNI